MVSIPLINKTNKTKFQGTFYFDSNNYEYTIYILPIKTNPEMDEIVSYFGNRRFKGLICLGLDEDVIRRNIKDNNVSAFIIVKPVGIDNIASGTIQIFDWCINPPSFSSVTKNQSTQHVSNIHDADIWINDVCRVSNYGNDKNPLKALFYIIEQLIVQNLKKTNIKLYIEPNYDNIAVLKPKYEALGFIKNLNNNQDTCPNWRRKELVLEKTDLAPELHIIDFSFLTKKPLRKNSITNKIRKNYKTHRKYKKYNFKIKHITF
jgi:hypothetical protein